ncbi:MAG: hypothetical protein M1828_007609 [Chrysothrix sp. TS-e1954]|nr:MAG: hypothetical protein M1828_007609 [Chrysothrix sp. TS-e1954]
MWVSPPRNPWWRRRTRTAVDAWERTVDEWNPECSSSHLAEDVQFPQPIRAAITIRSTPVGTPISPGAWSSLAPWNRSNDVAQNMEYSEDSPGLSMAPWLPPRSTPQSPLEPRSANAAPIEPRLPDPRADETGMTQSINEASARIPVMMAKLQLLLFVALSSAFSQSSPYLNAVNSNSTGVDLAIWINNGTQNDTAPSLGGLLFEDISRSGDGGLYGELLRNRAFQGSDVSTGHTPMIPYIDIVASQNPSLPFAPVIDGWSAIGDARLSLDLLHPLSDALEVSLQVDVPINATGEIGFENDGWWGIGVFPQTYNASFNVQANSARYNYSSTTPYFNVSLRSKTTGQTMANGQAGDARRVNPFRYTRFSTQIRNLVQAPDANNTLAVTWQAEKTAGQTLYFNLISLFGETYKDQPNGLRKDLAENLAALNPKFLRFPGGNNLEGYSIPRRWKWWKTIGPLEHRRGRPGDWSYYNTDGLGLLEYLQWCEAFSMEPFLVVYAGFSLELAKYDAANSTDANEWPIDEMHHVLQEVLDELEYCMGSPETYWGSKRALHGHPDPFNITYIGIGNEDFLSQNYPERAAFMHFNLKARYPNVTYIYSAYNENPSWQTKLEPGSLWDPHIYANPSHFIEQFNQWDNWREETKHPNVSIAVTEYHVASIDPRPGDPTFDPDNAAIDHPRMFSAVAEAIYAIGEERNSNTFRLSCYAPVIQNVHVWRHTGYDVLFDADPRNTLLSVSYYQQMMFNKYQGTQTLPFDIVDGGFNPLFWVASITQQEGIVFFKLVNAGNTTQDLSLKLDAAFVSVNGTILAAPEPTDLNGFNDFENRTAIVPKDILDLDEHGDWKDHKLKWRVPPYSVSVLQFDLESAIGEPDKHSKSVNAVIAPEQQALDGQLVLDVRHG